MSTKLSNDRIVKVVNISPSSLVVFTTYTDLSDWLTSLPAAVQSILIGSRISVGCVKVQFNITVLFSVLVRGMPPGVCCSSSRPVKEWINENGIMRME